MSIKKQLRPIKFRGISVDSGKEVIGNLITYPDNPDLVEIHHSHETEDLMVFTEVHTETVEEFSQRLDANGCEIFEGDRLDYGGSGALVIYNLAKGIFEAHAEMHTIPSSRFHLYKLINK